MSRIVQEEMINQLNISIVELMRQKEKLENEKKELENKKRELEIIYMSYLEKNENLNNTEKISDKEKYNFRYKVIKNIWVIVFFICLTYLFGNSSFLDFLKKIIAPS